MGSELRAKLGEVLARHPEVELAILIGSRARGTDRPGSDVDLAIQGVGVELLALAAELRHAVGAEVDLVELDRAGYPLLEAALRDGEVVHQGRPGAEALWRAQALSRTALDRPWYQRMRDGYLRKLAERAHG